MKIKPTPKARRFSKRARKTAPMPQLGKHHRRRSVRARPISHLLAPRHDSKYDHLIPNRNTWDT